MVPIVFLAAVLSSANTVDVPRMWSQLNAHCAAGRCELAEGSKLSDVANTTGESDLYYFICMQLYR